MKAGKLATGTLFYVLVAIIVFSAIFPFYYAILSSMKSGTEMFRADYFPLSWNFGNYRSVFRDQPFATNIWNSIQVSFAVVALSLFLAVTAAFALARIQFRGRGLLLLTILGVSMFPQVAVLSGMYQMIRAMGLYNHLLALVLSYMIFTLPFTVWVLTTFMRDLPKELEEAAIIEGASSWVIVTRVFLPLMWPALVTTGLLAFIAAWNEFLFALTFTYTENQRTVPLGIALMSGASAHELPWGNIMAASVLVTLPLIGLVLIFQRRIVSGLTAGAVKG
jgi:trehalose/maltose transport system permease protein